MHKVVLKYFSEKAEVILLQKVYIITWVYFILCNQNIKRKVNFFESEF